ncbi:YigZ family protein [Fulvivirga sp. RKSG066]|uniref:IMPACT family protein n=1 Tax=Fulvivirga aurantia TaxID=2529383 RepID=UPI0012BB8932|nr:YigZ family protein [Fulvivirga aurantia]MTI22189.1 YigZ family protein [Fulvivirga aurantia]
MSKPESYKTISTHGEGLYKEKGSKFIGLSFHVTSEEEVKVELEKLRATYHDARHHCYAYVLGAERKDYRANDDGEPNHSAGDPILGQINSKALTDVLVVVIRYFWGTKLGVSGLINAYKLAAEEALNNSKIITVAITERLELEYDYDATSEVMRLIDDYNIDIVDQQFAASCSVVVDVKIGLIDQVKEKLQLLIDTGSSITVK